MNDSSHPDFPEDQLPQEVVAELKSRHGPEILIPESVEASILSDAARQLNATQAWKLKRRRSGWMAWSTGTIAAAALVFLMLPREANDFGDNATEFASRGVSNEMESRTMAPAMESGAALSVVTRDVDQNGSVNILDAFALARQVESGAASSSFHQFDQNGDGQTNQEDINLIAMNVVTL